VTTKFANPDQAGRAMHDLATELFPICRSITGDGVRRTLQVLQRALPLQVHEVPTGTKVLDWTVPDEWNIRDAFIADAAGRRVVDFRANSLHVMSYSEPVRRRMPLAELRPHLHSLPDRPDWIPYRTSYYRRDWGFCLTHRQLEALPDGEYEVVIDSTLAPGSLTYGELVLPGWTGEEILLSAHVCHPALANDNLAGIAVLAHVGLALLARPERRHTFRLLFAPGTIGAITWLARNEPVTARIKHGLVLSCLGDDARPGMTYKRTRRGNAVIDRAVAHVLRTSGRPHELLDFSPYGYDERQYCSPGFNLPVGLFMRSCHGRYPEYHSSADNLAFIRPAALADSLEAVLRVIDVLEGNGTYVNLQPKGEPQLGRRGLYAPVGGQRASKEDELALLWVLNQSDGEHDLLAISERSGLAFDVVRAAADRLAAAGLLKDAHEEVGGA
jgi:aminopeptidase-like protein